MQHSLSMPVKLNNFCTLRVLKLKQKLPSKDKVGFQKIHENLKFICHFYSKQVNTLDFECSLNL